MALSRRQKTILKRCGYENFIPALDSLSEITFDLFVRHEEKLRDKKFSRECIVNVFKQEAVSNEEELNVIFTLIDNLSTLLLDFNMITRIAATMHGPMKLASLKQFIAVGIFLPLLPEDWVNIAMHDDGCLRIKTAIKNAKQFNSEGWNRDELLELLNPMVDYTDKNLVIEQLEKARTKIRCRVLTEKGYVAWLPELMKLAPKTLNNFMVLEQRLREIKIPNKNIVDIVLAEENGEKNLHEAIRYLNHPMQQFLKPMEYATVAASKCGWQRIIALSICLIPLLECGLKKSDILKIIESSALYDLCLYYNKKTQLPLKPEDLASIAQLDNATFRVRTAMDFLDLPGIESIKRDALLFTLKAPSVLDIPYRKAAIFPSTSMFPPTKRTCVSEMPYGFFNSSTSDHLSSTQKLTFIYSEQLAKIANSL